MGPLKWKGEVVGDELIGSEEVQEQKCQKVLGVSTNIKSMSPGIMARVEEELSTEIINE